LTVERILNEPTAAALAYGLDKLKDRAKIAVYDLGGGTFDLSILELTEGVFQVLSTHGDTRLGGDDLDKRVVELLVGKIKAAGGPDASHDLVLMSRIREMAEKAKIELSSETEVEIMLPFLTPSFSFGCRMSRRQLEDLHTTSSRALDRCLRSPADAPNWRRRIWISHSRGCQTRMCRWFGKWFLRFSAAPSLKGLPAAFGWAPTIIRRTVPCSTPPRIRMRPSRSARPFKRKFYPADSEHASS
jgi:hypothetical protein